jgi:hypothetical protein
MGTCILVMGLHRGGTSCVAGVLWRLGIDMNPTSGTLPGNTHEDVELQLLHEEAIYHWTDPMADFDRVRDRYIKAIREREQKELWGYKDPRLDFLLPDVLEILASPPKLIYVHRPNHLAAKGIVKANPGMSMEQAKEITKRYGRAGTRLFGLFKGEKIPISYDILVEHPKAIVEEIAGFVGVPIKQEAIDFVDPTLRHFRE